MARFLVRHRRDRARGGSTRVRPGLDAIRERGVAGDLLPVRKGTLIHEHGRISLRLSRLITYPTGVPLQRIGLAVVVSLGLALTPLAGEAQPTEKVARVGILGIGPVPSPQDLAKSVSTNPFWMSMRQLGWVDGQNMVVERRFGESADQLRTGAADLVRLKVDVLFVSSAGLAKILQRETKTIPIVIGRADEDLVAAGLVDSLARPGGNITGSQLLNDDLIPKRLELLKALIPNLSKVALLREDVTTSALPQAPARSGQEVAIPAARGLGIDVHNPYSSALIG